MLVQIPVFIALYWVLLESVELRQAPFILWLRDLSTKDPYYVLPLIMGATMFFQQKLNPPPPEAVADPLDSASHAAARSALRSLEGAPSERIRALVERRVTPRMYAESAIDIPEEEIDFLGDGHLAAALASLISDIEDLLATSEQGRLLRDGMRVVIAGRPNAGKSSLLNRLAQHDAAIVTDIPGTTRDVLREHI